MALRATSGPTLSTRSVVVGKPVQVSVKVENTGAGEESVGLWVEDLKEGALGKPYSHPFVFDPPAAAVPGKARKSLSFTWTAELPEGKTAHTFRGRLVLKRTTDGALVGEAPLDLYVSS